LKGLIVIVTIIL